MGVRARRWQLWLITMFILTGVIGMIQLFKGPESAEAVTLSGGSGNTAIALPTRTLEATELPAWEPTGDAAERAAAEAAAAASAAATRRAPVSGATAVANAKAAKAQTSAADQGAGPAIGANQAAAPATQAAGQATAVTTKTLAAPGGVPTRATTAAKATATKAAATKATTTKATTSKTTAAPTYPRPSRSRPGSVCRTYGWRVICR